MINIPSRAEIIKYCRENNKIIALIFPIYYPASLLRTFDIHPMEIWNSRDTDISNADEHIQSYTCSIGRILLSFVKDKRFDKDYDLIFIPHICDTFQQIGSLLTDFINLKKPVINFYIPKRFDDAGINFGVSELRELINKLERITNKRFDKDRFVSEIKKDMEINSLLSRVYDTREFLNISDRKFYEIIQSRTYLPPEQLKHILETLLNTKGEKPRSIEKRIFISGITFEPLQLFDFTSGLGSGIVFDDLAISQRRIFSYKIEPDRDPLRAQIEMILLTEPDPEKGSPISNRVERLMQKITKTGAKGGIFYIMKFCEPEYFDYPQIREYLKKNNIKTFLIEYELKNQISKQNINRLQAFIEGL